jgi:hypothetical protein
MPNTSTFHESNLEDPVCRDGVGENDETKERSPMKTEVARKVVRRTHKKNGEVIAPEELWVYRDLKTHETFMQIRPLFKSDRWRLIGKYLLSSTVKSEVAKERKRVVREIKEWAKQWSRDNQYTLDIPLEYLMQKLRQMGKGGGK